MAEWKEIESAPKDGTSILVCDARIRDWQQVVWWDDNPALGKYKWARDDWDSHWHEDMFTHWQPLQPPPAPSQKEQG